MEIFGIPTAFAKFCGQPIEQSPVDGCVALHAKIFTGFNEAKAEESLPVTVDDDASGERLFGTDEPAGEAQAIARSLGGEWRQESGRGKRDFFQVHLVVAAIKDEGVAGLVVIHHHDARILISFEAIEFTEEVIDLGVEDGEDLLKKVAAQIASRKFESLLGGEGGGCAQHGIRKFFIAGDFGFPVGTNFCDELIRFHRGELRFERGELGFMFGGCEIEHGGGGADFGRGSVDDAVFRDVIKTGEQGVVIALGDRIKFVVVALGAGDGEAQPVGGGGIDAVEESDVTLLLGDGTTFAVEEMVAIKGGRDALLGGGRREQVAGELFDRKLIEGLIRVEGFNYPVAPNPLEGVAVLLIAVGISVAGGIEPRQRHAFAIMWGGQQAIDQALVGVGRFIGEKVFEFGGRRRETRQIEGHAPNEGGARCFGTGGNLFNFESSQHEAIDRIVHPFFPADGWRGGAGNGGKGPMGSVGGALGDPALQQGFLREREGAVGISGRHLLIIQRGKNARDEITVIRLMRNNDLMAQLALAGVEAQFGFTLGGILTVTVKTIFGQNRPNILGVVHGWRGRDRASGSEGSQVGEDFF